MHLQSIVSSTVMLPATGPAWRYRLGSGNDPGDGTGEPAHFARTPAAPDDLPYRVELWDETRMAVEQVLAVTAHGSIGYAAYYAATREYPDRYITLRHRHRTVARSNTPQD